MDKNQAFLQKITWGVLLIVVAAALISIGILQLPFLIVIPLVLLIMGIWTIATGASFYHRAWGVVLAVAGGLWLSQWFYPLSLYVTGGIFLAVVGLLVIVGSRK